MSFFRRDRRCPECGSYMRRHETIKPPKGCSRGDRYYSCLECDLEGWVTADGDDFHHGLPKGIQASHGPQDRSARLRAPAA